MTSQSNREICLRLAEGRRRRMVNGRPQIDLTEAEVRASVGTAMRLAGYVDWRDEHDRVARDRIIEENVDG